MVQYFLWREANWNLHCGSSNTTSKSRAIAWSSLNLARGKPRVCNQPRLQAMFQKKRGLTHLKMTCFITNLAFFSYLLEAPKFDMREAYEFGMQNQGCLGRKASSNRGPITQSSREQEKKFASNSSPV